jgi:hypothetical protein
MMSDLARHSRAPLRLLRIVPPQDRVDIGNLRRLGNAVCGRLQERVRFHFQATAAVFGIALKLRLDPLSSRADALAGIDRLVILCGNGGPIAEADQLLYRLPDTVG